MLDIIGSILIACFWQTFSRAVILVCGIFSSYSSNVNDQSQRFSVLSYKLGLAVLIICLWSSDGVNILCTGHALSLV